MALSPDPPIPGGPQSMPTREGAAPDEAISNPMQYIDTDDPEVVKRYQHINTLCYATYEAILNDCPQSAERTLAIRKLQEARMWANAAVAFDGRRYRT